MNNKGVTNHIRFRTKYWQEKHSTESQRHHFLEDGMIQGEKINQKFFHNPRITRINKINQRSAKMQEDSKEQQKRIFQSLRRVQRQKRDNRMSLKLQLMNLTIENYEFSRPKSTLNSRQSRSAYKGKTQLNKLHSSFRPSTSITIQLEPFKQYDSLQQNVSLIENNRYSIFLPNKSAKFSRIHA